MNKGMKYAKIFSNRIYLLCKNMKKGEWNYVGKLYFKLAGHLM
jgi:hypothetical protein